MIAPRPGSARSRPSRPSANRKQNRGLDAHKHAGKLRQMTSYDYYAEARAVAAVLSGRGWKAEATGILEAMAHGSTGSEVCMALRFELSAVASRAGLSSDTQRRVAALHRRLDDLLR